MLEVEMWQAREEVAAVNGRIRQCCDRVAPQLHRWRRIVRANLRVLDSMQLFGKTARTTFINGWVPTRRVEHVTRALKDALADRVLVEASTPDADAGLARELMDSGRVLVPTKFRHPFFLKPFEGLVTTYGYPEYNGVDPTFFVAATFLIMFGIMFGDVGHGLVLAAIGLFVARSKLFAEFAQAGWLLFSAGVSATLFGFMFGSLFGLEGIIPAIWIIPFQQVTKILVAAIMLGIGIITLGIILNVVQAYAQRNFKEALFGQWGLVSGSFYWMALGVFYITLVAKHEVPFGLVIIVLLVPIVLVVLGDLFYARLFGGAHTDEVHDDAEHSFAEVIFKPVEITLGFVTHTVSFVRVGAFGLNHAALMMVVYVLAEMGGGLTGPNATFSSQASYIFSAIVGNIFVMMLEGLVVFIQCLRLEYYEFFSKFFSGEGVRYEPLQVEDL
jgi:V/A-type H+-transporting ATPase subunit I